MGGVASFVEDTFSAVGDVVGDVGNVVGEAGDFISDEIMDPVMTEVAEPIMNVVSKTVDAAMEDPVGTAVQVGTAIYAPALLPAVNGAVALSRGANFEDALKVSALSYAGQQAGQFVGGEVSAGLEDSIGKAGASTAGKIAAGATSTAVRGGNVEDALTAGALGAGTAVGLSQVPGFGELDPWQQRAASTVVSSALMDKSPAVALADQLLTGAVNTATGAGTKDASTLTLGDTTLKANPLQTTLPLIPRDAPAPPPVFNRPAIQPATAPSKGIASVQPEGFETFAGFDQNQGITGITRG